MSSNILLVEDDPITREILTIHLENFGCHLRVATEFQTAWQMLQKELFSCLILDRNFPGGSAMDLLKEIRSSPESLNRNTPAIAISAELPVSVKRALIEAGFVASLEKPVSGTSLRDVLRNMGITLAVPISFPSPISVCSDSLLVLDDERALMVCGDHDVVQGLRALLAAELPGYRQQMKTALATLDQVLMRDAIHRLKSALGFCGGAQLLGLLDEAGSEIPDRTQWDKIERAMEALHRQLPAASPAL